MLTHRPTCSLPPAAQRKKVGTTRLAFWDDKSRDDPRDSEDLRRSSLGLTRALRQTHHPALSHRDTDGEAVTKAPPIPLLMASHFSIPRFLLPQSGPVWRRANLGNRLRNPEALRLVVRYYASSNAAKTGRPSQQRQKQKVIVLEKPDKFNPPSHGARLPSKNRPPQQHYGGPVSGDEAAAQRKKDYPGLPPPQGTWSHWFWHSRGLHATITMVRCVNTRKKEKK